MNDRHEVISAFLDGEAFEPTALGEALADPGGRAMLIDLLALRHLVAESPEAAPVRQPRAGRLLYAVAAAAIVLASFVGYSLGERQGAAAVDAPPTPTRVVQPTTGWQSRGY
jgi:hypothetical protein